jgi:hypothetical protein
MPEDVLAVSQSVAKRFGASIGLHVSVTASPTAQGLYEGSMTIGVTGADGDGTSEVFPIRAAYAEIQRRSAMNAADVLRRFINAMKA